MIRKNVLISILITLIISMSGCGKVFKSQEFFVNNDNLFKKVSQDTLVQKRYEENEKSLFAELEYLKPTDLPPFEELKSHYNAYKKRYIELGLESIHVMPILYQNRVNLSAIDKFKRLDIDLYELSNRNFSGRHGLERNESILIYTPVIVLGKVTDITDYSSEEFAFHSCYKVKIEKILKGEYYFKTEPDFIQVFTRFKRMQPEFLDDGRIIVPEDVAEYIINGTYIFLLGNTPCTYYFDKYKEYAKLEEKESIEKKKYYQEIIKPTSFSAFFRIPYSKVKIGKSILEVIDEIEEINDSRGFFKRSP